MFIFVYGTLRKGTAAPMHRILARHGKFVADGFMQGRLYDVGDYPGAIESDSPGDRVYGELYRIANGGVVLPILDQYEGCTGKFPAPHEYIRNKLPVTRLGGGKVSAWVYLFNHDVSGLERIASGDYLKHLRKPKHP